MTDIHLVYNTGTDVSNRREACNRKTNSGLWKESISSELYGAVHGKERKAASTIILQHIDQNYGTVDMKKREEHLTLALEKDKKTYLKKMETLTRHPLPHDEITCYITTLPRCPYHRQKGLLWMRYKAQDPVRIFLHELLHFQFHRRYRNNPKVTSLSEDQFEDLKESLTFLLNIEFKEFIEFPDYGYPQHQQLRKQLEEYWLSQPENERDFEKLIDYGCKLLSQTTPMEDIIIGTMVNENFEERILDTPNYKPSSVRGIAFDTEGKVALIYSSKEKYYKLPGGGVEEGEDNLRAMKREIKEEVGADVEVRQYIGTIVEQNKTGKVIQKNRGFVAKVVEKSEPQLTEEELARGFTTLRIDIDEAIELMTKNSPINYRGNFMQERDLRFLQEAKKTISS